MANTAALDFETTPTFSLQVRASDNGSPSLSTTATVTISLTDVAEILTVNIDVVPGDSTNTIRLAKRFDVAILSTSSFDARTVDVDSVRFGKLGTENSGVRTGRNQQITYSYRDVNGDGRQDLVIQIEPDDTGLRVGDTQAKLSGLLTNGKKIAATSAVVVKK